MDVGRDRRTGDWVLSSLLHRVSEWKWRPCRVRENAMENVKGEELGTLKQENRFTYHGNMVKNG